MRIARTGNAGGHVSKISHRRARLLVTNDALFGDPQKTQWSLLRHIAALDPKAAARERTSEPTILRKKAKRAT
jgi:hypothetical protein